MKVEQSRKNVPYKRTIHLLKKKPLSVHTLSCVTGARLSDIQAFVDLCVAHRFMRYNNRGNVELVD